MTAASDAVAIAIILRMRTADGFDDDRVALISCRSSTRREEEGGASWRFGSSPHPRPSPPSFAAAGSPPLFSRNRSDSILQGDSTYPRGGTMLCLDMEFVAHVFVLFFLSLGNEHVNSLLTSPPQVNTYIFCLPACFPTFPPINDVKNARRARSESPLPAMLSSLFRRARHPCVRPTYLQYLVWYYRPPPHRRRWNSKVDGNHRGWSERS